MWQHPNTTKTYTVDSLKRILQGYNVATSKHNKEAFYSTYTVDSLKRIHQGYNVATSMIF